MVENPASLKQAMIETLAYVCQKVFPQNLEVDQLNPVLSVVLRSMSSIDDTCDLCLAATRALCNALDCSLINFNDEPKRNRIIKALLKTSASKEVEIKHATFESFLSISSTCYEVLEPYMQAIFDLTINAVNCDEEAVALRAIDTWSSICDGEIEMLQEYGNSHGSPPYLEFIVKSLPSIVPVLLERMLKHEDEDQDDDVPKCLWLEGLALGSFPKLLVMK